MSGEKSGKRFLNQKKEIKMSEYSGCDDFSDLEKAYGIKKKNKKKIKKLSERKRSKNGVRKN